MRELNVSTKVINEILRAKDNNRLMHVYLFYGSDETSMKDTAFTFAANLYCGCLNCPLCESILDDNHLNVKYVGIEEGKNLITKEQITSIEEEFMQTSLILGPRVYIIDGIDTASTAAQNSLLKFIEDPAMQDEVYGILIAKSIDNVLPTIKSRCGLMHFKSNTKEEMMNLLEGEYSPDDTFILSALAKNKLDAKNLFISPLYQDLKEIFYDFLNINNSEEGVLFYLKYNKISNSLLQSFLKLLISFYESTLVKRKLISSPLYDKIGVINSRVSLSAREKRLECLLELEIKTHYNVITKNILHELIVLFF